MLHALSFSRCLLMLDMSHILDKSLADRVETMIYPDKV